MPNTNCLEGIKCPDCGNEDRFLIVSTVTASVTDNGAEIAESGGSFEWDRNSPTGCPECWKPGKLADFMTTETAAYRYERGADGTDETIDLISPTGEHLASVPCRDDREGAEEVAGRVADLFNAIYPSNTAT